VRFYANIRCVIPDDLLQACARATRWEWIYCTPVSALSSFTGVILSFIWCSFDVCSSIKINDKASSPGLFSIKHKGLWMWTGYTDRDHLLDIKAMLVFRDQLGVKSTHKSCLWFIALLSVAVILSKEYLPTNLQYMSLNIMLGSINIDLSFYFRFASSGFKWPIWITIYNGSGSKIQPY